MIQVRGERGEILNDRVTCLKDYLTPITYRLIRAQTGIEGNLEGFDLKGIQGNGDWVYRNPYRHVRKPPEHAGPCRRRNSSGSEADCETDDICSLC